MFENPKALGYSHDMLIYPSKIKTDEIYLDFLCICRDETRLSTALSQISKVSQKMVKKYGNNSSPLKNIILITDKWNVSTFEKYKQEYLYNAKKYNIWLVIFLICGEELQQIPFLPNDDRMNTDALPELRDIERYPITRKAIRYPLDGFTFEVFLGPWNQTGGYRYWFNPESLNWHKESVTGDCKNGRIPIRSLEKFMRNVEKLLNKKGANLIPGHNSCDDPGYVLNLFERVIEWAYSDTENNPDLKKLQLIVDEFIQKCDKEY